MPACTVGVSVIVSLLRWTKTMAERAIEVKLRENSCYSVKYQHFRSESEDILFSSCFSKRLFESLDLVIGLELV